MNYHLMIDDKFIDGFIRELEALSPASNTYIFAFDHPPQYVTSEKGVFAPYRSAEFQKLTRRIEVGDTVFIHWLHDDAAQFILGLPKEIEVAAFFWGGDFLADPMYFRKATLLGPLSRRLYDSQFEYPVFVTKNPITLLKRTKYKYSTYRKIQSQRKELKTRAVKRLDCLFHWNISDHREVEDLYDTKMRSLYFYYDAGVDTELSALSNPYVSRKGKTKIWLGNSSSITNNHLEGLAFLGQYKERDVEIYCPLSYGDEMYGDVIQERGERIFGSKFIAIRRFMERKEYYDLLNEIDIVVMNHHRTQAAGNVLAFLKLGKKIFMKAESTLFQLLRRSGAEICPIPQGSLEFDKFADPLNEAIAASNHGIAEKVFSEEKKRSTLKSVFSG